MYTLSSYNVGTARDAIKLLLKLGKDTHKQNNVNDIEINYAKSTRDVYIDFILKVVKKSKSLDIICLPWAPRQDEQHARNLPSWITPIEKRPYDKPYDTPEAYFSRVNADSLIGRLGVKTYKAAGHVSMAPTRDYAMPAILGADGALRSDLRLQVNGRIIGTIQKLGVNAEGGRIHISWLEMAVKFAKRPQMDSDDADADGLFIPEAFWRTLVADRGPQGTAPPSWYLRACQCCFAYVKRNRGFNGILDTDKEVHTSMINPRGILNRPVVQFLRRVQAATWNRRFMITPGGKFGLVPAETVEGDRLALLWGCTVPVVLRPKGKY